MGLAACEIPCTGRQIELRNALRWPAATGGQINHHRRHHSSAWWSRAAPCSPPALRSHGTGARRDALLSSVPPPSLWSHVDGFSRHKPVARAFWRTSVEAVETRKFVATKAAHQLDLHALHRTSAWSVSPSASSINRAFLLERLALTETWFFRPRQGSITWQFCGRVPDPQLDSHETSEIHRAVSGAATA